MDRRKFLWSGLGTIGSLPLSSNAMFALVPSKANAGLATPTSDQLAWQNLEVGMFVHWLVDKGDWQEKNGDGIWRPRNNASYPNTDNWVECALGLGARYIVFVAKHAIGFCMWQTNTTNFSIGHTPWQGGHGDILRDISASCKKYGLKLGVYVSPHDEHFGAGGGGLCKDPSRQQAYNALYREQLTEVLTRYGQMTEVWFDGSVMIPVGDILHRYAPHAMIFQGPEATIRWVGEEEGFAPYPLWAALSAADAKTGIATALQGDPKGDVWMPVEADVSIRRPNWFATEENANRLMTYDQLLDVYYRSVGRGSQLLLNISPYYSGLMPPEDVARAREVGDEIRRRFHKSVAEISGNDRTLVLPLMKGQRLDHAILQEDCRFGQRVLKYRLEGLAGTQWTTLGTGSSIGHKRIHPFEPQKLDAVRLSVTNALRQPQIRRFAVFNTHAKPPQGWDAPVSAGIGNAVGHWDQFKFNLDLTEKITAAAQYSLRFFPKVGHVAAIEKQELYLDGVPHPELLRLEPGTHNVLILTIPELGQKVVLQGTILGAERGVIQLQRIRGAQDSSCSASKAPRTKQLINAAWRFQIGDHTGAEAVKYDDRAWQHIGLPHSLGIPYFGSAQFYIGYGWYRKHLQIVKLPEDQRMSIEFDGVFQDAEVFLNGKRVGRHQGGYTGFTFDVTSAVQEGDNVLAIRVNNLWNPRLNPRAGEHQFNGGIYRNVYLVKTSDVCVDWYGTFVTTPGLSKAGAPVHIATDIRNSSSRSRLISLRTDILDPSGQQVATVTSKQIVDAGAVLTVQQTTPFVSKPMLWDPGHPTLYTAVSQVIDGTREVDRYTTPFGFRWFRWTAEKGFFLNGKHHYFHGANAHQDHAGWGDAVTNAGIARDVRLVKDAGMDFIRGSHYPHSPIFSDECDKQGILLWSENSFWGTGGNKETSWSASAYPPNQADQKPFEENVKRSLREMIRIHRNHPSIIAWSMGNEVFFSQESLMPKVRPLIQALVAEAHQLDPSRPAGMGGVQRGNLDKLSDIAGYNGDGAKLFLDPGVPNFVAEYGSVVAARPGQYIAGLGDLADQPQFSWRSGQALWCAFDHGSIHPPAGHMGMVDYFRLPKRQWYWYRSAYRKVRHPEWPQHGTATGLHLETDKPGTIGADGTDDVQLIATIRGANGEHLSNALPLRLEIVSGPGEFPTGRSIQFAPDSDISIRDGQAAIELRSYQSGQIVVRATSPGLKPAELVLHAVGGPRFVPGVTRLAAARPYIQPTVPSPLLSSTTDISLDRPTRSSSDAEGHSSQMANDGDPTTCWQPQSNNADGAWWQVDFESRCRLQSIHLAFQENCQYRHIIQISDDSSTWRTLVDHGTATGAITQIDKLPKEAIGRMMRITFKAVGHGGTPRLVEVKIIGALLS